MKKEKNSYAMYGIAVLLVLFAGYFLLNSSSTNDGSASEGSGFLEASEENWDLGDISMKDGLNTKTIQLTNTSADPVTVTQMKTSCMCTSATIVRADGSRGQKKGMVGHGGTPYVSETIQPGERASLEIVYDPNAHGPNATGPIRRTVFLSTSSPDQPELQLDFTGNVTK